MTETPVCFPCAGDWLYGLVHEAHGGGRRGVLVIVGGPQYRVGSHRQFTLLARRLAQRGIPVMRFDYRGMGDSDGEPGVPEPCEHLTADIRTAIDAFHQQCPQLREVVLWGLCDGASAALMYAAGDPRVSGVIALNPWVSSDRSEARIYLKYYYVRRLFSRELWRKARRGQLDVAASARSLLGKALVAAGFRERGTAGGSDAATAPTPASSAVTERVTRGLSEFNGKVLFIFSGNDRIAAEFKDVARKSRRLRKLLTARRIASREQPVADHTFSRREWRDQIADWSAEWIGSW